MSFSIINGTGNGHYEAKVDSGNRLHTFAASRTQMAATADSYQRSFIVYTPLRLTVTTTQGLIFWFKNTSNNSRHFHISKMFASTDTAGTIIQYNVGVGEPSANNTAFTPVNTNLGSNVAAEMSAYYWDEVGTGMTASAGSPGPIHTFGVGLYTVFIDSGIIVPPAVSVGFYAESPSSTAEVSITVSGHFEDKDTE